MDFLDRIEELENVVFENEIEFLDTFAKGLPEELVGVKFGSEGVDFTYILECGQHVCDGIKMDEFLKWYEEA